ncbi:MAG: terminase small subunit protein [Ochrobactrum anthropi]|uniref:Terminase small subunit protein n=1 Tax=Brucella anthropi TaxID=529 RepID=A0A8I0N2P9_BRUAN|nr:terminase small subunit protein [Brucella anthropi]MBE0559910.1 terminase small subunit protein [Brucella anthropi]
MSEKEVKTGRPTKFSQALADAICERIADGDSLRTICDEEGFPARSTVFKWLSQNAAFADQYAHAREAQADAIFDDILEIADDGQNDWMEKHSKEGENIGWQENGEALRRSQLRIDARKWMAGKLRPKRYGDRTQMELTGPQGEDGEPTAIQFTIVDPKR